MHTDIVEETLRHGNALPTLTRDLALLGDITKSNRGTGRLGLRVI